MSKFTRYIVVGSRKLIEHGYSTMLGDDKARRYAVDCANHYTMQGSVYGETRDGSRQLVYTFKDNSKQEK